MVNSNPDTNLVWIDLEMTGLDLDKCQITEIAVAITNKDLELLDDLDLVINLPEDAYWEDEAKNQSRDSGLLDKINTSRISLKNAETQVVNFISKYSSELKSPMCGKNVGWDRKFVAKYMKDLHVYLHHKNIDVSSIKELYHRWRPGQEIPVGNKGHRALDDILEAIDELKYFVKVGFINS